MILDFLGWVILNFVLFCPTRLLPLAALGLVALGVLVGWLIPRLR